MDISVVLAKFWGGFFIIFGALFIVTKQLGRTIEMTEDKEFVISTGYITLLLGLITVVLHNVWELHWSLAITLLGWSTLIKGVAKVGFPDLVHQQAQKFKKNQNISGLALIFFGGWLIWMSLS